tara:strand:+ start:329 stop:637 length:309 start_codon:yes stop_codon:yes gene_type:complete
MSNVVYLDVRGEPTFGIGICARCSRKFKLADLASDPNYPNLMVCEADRDDYDPYRLAPRKEDQIILPFTRPDTQINTRPAGVIQEAGNEFFVTEDGNGYLEF